VSDTVPPRPKLLYLVTEDWAFRVHRLPMARAARNAGFDVSVMARVNGPVEDLEAEGFHVIPLPWNRRSLNPFESLAAVWRIARTYRRERPDLIHHVAVKPVLLGGLAAWLTGRPAVVNALTGLGTLFIGSGGLKTRTVGLAARALLRFVLTRPNGITLFQNGDDRDLLTAQGMADPARTRLIRGSGIDTNHFAEAPELPSPPVTLAYVGRLIADKGVRELVEAYRTLRDRGHDLRLIITGAPDPENPTTVRPDELAAWKRLDGVELTGELADVRPVWARAHIAVLLSRREGLPRSLLEAAAMGRAIVATDVPGCREIAVDGANAALVPLDDPAALVMALERLIVDGDLRHRFGTESRRMVLSDLSAEAVAAAVLDLYREAMGQGGHARVLK
jgi:glycosyltransferase involved in cell wall biosynthesis